LTEWIKTVPTVG